MPSSGSRTRAERPAENRRRVKGLDLAVGAGWSWLRIGGELGISRWRLGACPSEATRERVPVQAGTGSSSHSRSRIARCAIVVVFAGLLDCLADDASRIAPYDAVVDVAAA